MKEPTLLILAGGLSSRYKTGLKQLDAFGPSGESLMDYAIYDAIRAGFAKVVFVIREEIKDNFEKQVVLKYGERIRYNFVFQDTDDLPSGFQAPVTRKKPWGTGHAVWAARYMIKEPFAVINADDFYGSTPYSLMAAFLKKKVLETGKYAMAGFNLLDTISEHGSVSRGICKVKKGLLLEIVEQTNVCKDSNGNAGYKNKQGLFHPVAPDTIVSMNFWGFLPDFFSKCEASFKSFLEQNINNGEAEFYLPQCVNEQVKSKNVTVQVLSSSGQWLGVTYPNDKTVVKKKLGSNHKKGLYPSPLFNNAV